MSNDNEEPIEDELSKRMKAAAKAMDTVFSPHGFALLVFPMGDVPEARMNYISNAEREPMLRALQEFVNRHSGGLAPQTIANTLQEAVDALDRTEHEPCTCGEPEGELTCPYCDDMTIARDLMTKVINLCGNTQGTA